jgi:hypothetical protein
MKKLLIGIFALGSLSALGSDRVTLKCEIGQMLNDTQPGPPLLIQVPLSTGPFQHTVRTVHIQGKTDNAYVTFYFDYLSKSAPSNDDLFRFGIFTEDRVSVSIRSHENGTSPISWAEDEIPVWNLGDRSMTSNTMIPLTAKNFSISLPGPEIIGGEFPTGKLFCSIL